MAFSGCVSSRYHGFRGRFSQESLKPLVLYEENPSDKVDFNFGASGSLLQQIKMAHL